MPIAQLNIEGRYPKYTWASKPAANSVSAGTRVTITGLTAPDSDWVSNGAYWAPVGGTAILVRKNLQSFAGAFPTNAEVVGAFGGFIIPDGLLMSPGAPTFEVRVQARRLGTLASTQAAQLSVGTDTSQSFLGLHSIQSASGSDSVVRLYSATTQTGPGNYQSSGVPGFQPTGTIVGGTTLFNLISGKPIRLYAQNGSTDTSETWTFHMCELGVRL
jgi:hypothetical protein